MKVLIVHPYSFAKYKGGVERYCKNLEKGLSLHVEISQLNGHYFKLFGEPIPTIKNFQIIKEKKPDILHLQGPRPFATIVGIFGKILGKRTVLTYHSYLNPKNYLRRAVAVLDRLISKYIFDFLIVTSEEYRKKVRQFFPENKIKIIPLLIEEHFFKYSRSKEECRKELLIGQEKVALFVGKLDRHHYFKGLDVLIKAAKLLPGGINPIRSKSPKATAPSEAGTSNGVKIIIAGDGDKRRECEQMVLKLALEEKVKFVGEISSDEILMRYYRASDVLVLPSTSDTESFGFVLLEAMAGGLPIITTNVVGSASLIGAKKAGIIIPPNNPEALANAIQKLLEEKSLYQRLQENGKKFAEEFRIQKNINKFLEVYKCAAEKTRY